MDWIDIIVTILSDFLKVIFVPAIIFLFYYLAYVANNTKSNVLTIGRVVVYWAI